jgi:hypothetical protein
VNFWKKREVVPEPARGRPRHRFVIGPICYASANLERGRLYYCTACRWKFLVCGTKVAVLAENGSALVGAEAIERFSTFAEGPCPVLEEFASALSSKIDRLPLLLEGQSDRLRNPAHGHGPARSVYLASSRPRRIER